MYELPPERKQYLLRQNEQFRKAVQTSIPAASTHASQSVSVGPASSAVILPRLMPQLTGDMLIKRFSGWGSGSPTSPGASANANRRSSNDLSSRRKEEADGGAVTPLRPQTTGWSSWWTSSGGSAESIKSVKSYLDGIRAHRLTDIKLVKNMISLRVHLSTAKLAWIEEFITEKGLEVLSTILSGLVGREGKRRTLGDVESTVLLELMKCLRVLLNTEVSQCYEPILPTDDWA